MLMIESKSIFLSEAITYVAIPPLSFSPVVGQDSEETTSHLPTVIKGYMRQIEELK